MKLTELYSGGHAGAKENDRADTRLAGKATITSVVPIWEGPRC